MEIPRRRFLGLAAGAAAVPVVAGPVVAGLAAGVAGPAPPVQAAKTTRAIAVKTSRRSSLFLCTK